MAHHVPPLARMPDRSRRRAPPISPRLSVARENSGATEMTGRNLGAAPAKVEEEEHIKSQVVTEMLCFHYMILVVAIGLSISGLVWSRYSSPAMDVIVTVLCFTLVTIAMQLILAISMASKPAPSRIPSALNEWMVAISAWLFLVTYFLIYASMSLHALEPSYWDLIVAGIASGVNLAITVYTMLHRPIQLWMDVSEEEDGASGSLENGSPL